MIRTGFIVIILTSLVACSGPDRKKRAEPLEVFATHIHADGSKLFVFTLEMQQGKGQQGERARGGGAGGKPGGD